MKLPSGEWQYLSNNQKNFVVFESSAKVFSSHSTYAKRPVLVALVSVVSSVVCCHLVWLSLSVCRCWQLFAVACRCLSSVFLSGLNRTLISETAFFERRSKNDYTQEQL